MVWTEEHGSTQCVRHIHNNNIVYYVQKFQLNFEYKIVLRGKGERGREKNTYYVHGLRYSRVYLKPCIYNRITFYGGWNVKSIDNTYVYLICIVYS